MLIRAATVEDVPGVLPMVRAISQLHAQRDPERFAVLPDVLDRYSRWLPERANDPRSVFLVAEQEDRMQVAEHTDDASAAKPSATGHLVGFAVCTIEPEVPIFWVPECGWIHDLYVVPSARRRGVAREFVREITARYAAIGVRQLRLHTATFNDAARATFAEEGFRPCVVEMLKTLPTSA